MGPPPPKISFKTTTTERRNFYDADEEFTVSLSLSLSLFLSLSLSLSLSIYLSLSSLSLSRRVQQSLCMEKTPFARQDGDELTAAPQPKIEEGYYLTICAAGMVQHGSKVE
jgi:hypothetical protein